jgi:endonuclease/exonuclease/phosphatase family metal-dependent hydrolase
VGSGAPAWRGHGGAWARAATLAAAVRVLTWNLFHGRAVPPAGRPLLREFAAALAGWEWDVALLQEVPPWWPQALARATGAEAYAVRTSRNALLPVRRALAARRPDLVKANGGGANVILARLPVVAHARRRLALLPERRWAHGVRLADGGWVVNLHATVRPPERAAADVERAAAAAGRWAAGSPLVLGGDFNLRRPEVPGLRRAAGHYVDHVLVAGWEPAGPADVLDPRPLSDHRPVAVGLRRSP